MENQATIINTSNPESITYTTEELSFTILGGIKLEGLDRLRVTLKIEVANRKFKHYLNNPDIADLALQRRRQRRRPLPQRLYLRCQWQYQNTG